ncbi:unnamed protein product, partial [Darwinula stevensoni]
MKIHLAKGRLCLTPVDLEPKKGMSLSLQECHSSRKSIQIHLAKGRLCLTPVDLEPKKGMSLSLQECHSSRKSIQVCQNPCNSLTHSMLSYKMVTYHILISI